MTTPVITGAGSVCAFGVGLAALFDGLAAGRSAVSPISCFDTRQFPSRVGGEVEARAADAGWLCRQIDAPAELCAHWQSSGRLRDRKVPFALLAAVEAWRAAGCGPPDRGAGLSVAFGMEAIYLDELAAALAARSFEGRAGVDLPPPPGHYRSSFDGGALAIEELLGLEGPVAVHASACAGGALAVGHAAALIERGQCDIVLCGAADSMLNPMALGGLCRLGVTSARNESDACRPFDARRDGLVVGEGAAMFVVESEARARARGVTPWATILGWGSSHDGHRIAAPRADGTGAARAIAMALARAKLSPDAVGYVNAHGTGTPLNDAAEARALHAALGSHAERVPVSSIKGAIGHLMAASGAIELAASLLPLRRAVLPPTAHYATPDPACSLRIIGPDAEHRRVDCVLSNSFGFGGQNAAVLLGRVA